MKRLLLDNLIEWKDKKHRKPLIHVFYRVLKIPNHI